MSNKITDTPNRLAGDVRGTQDLREKFAKDPQGGLKAAAQQFEAMFLQMVMKSMRDATPQDGLFNSDQTRFYTSMLDQQLAQNMATSGKGLGFAKLIEEQLGRHMLPTGNGDAGAAKDAAQAAQKAAIQGLGLDLTTSHGSHLQGVRSLPPQPQNNTQASEAPAPVVGEGASASAKEFAGREIGRAHV